jgi:hypothetical protein
VSFAGRKTVVIARACPGTNASSTASPPDLKHVEHRRTERGTRCDVISIHSRECDQGSLGRLGCEACASR